MDSESDEAESVYDTASSANSRLGPLADTNYQVTITGIIQKQYTMGQTSPSDQCRSARCPVPQVQSTEIQNWSPKSVEIANPKKIPTGEFAATIDEVLASNDEEPAQNDSDNGCDVAENPKDDDHRSISSEICVSPSWSRAAQKKREKMEQKRKMERERKELERRLKREANRKPDSREPRRLRKRAPPVSSSRASSAHSTFQRPSTASSFASFWSRRTSRASSVNEQSQDEVKKKRRRFSFGVDNPSKSKLKFPNVWSRRSAKPQERSFEVQRPDRDSTFVNPNRHSLHTVKRHFDLRASARASESNRDTVQQNLPPGLVRQEAQRVIPARSNERLENDSKNSRRDTVNEGAAMSSRVFSNQKPRFPFQATNDVEPQKPQKKPRSHSKSTPTATQSPSLGSRAIAGTDRTKPQNETKRHTSEGAGSEAVAEQLRASGDGTEEANVSHVENKLLKRTSSITETPSANQSGKFETVDDLPGAREFRDSPNIRHSSSISQNVDNPNAEDQVQSVTSKIANYGNKTPAYNSSSQRNISTPEHPRMPSSYIKDAIFRSSPLAGPPLVVQEPVNTAEVPVSQEQAQYTIESVQSTSKARRNSFQGYLESKRLSIPRLLGQVKRGKDGANADATTRERVVSRAEQKSVSMTPKSESTAISLSALTSTTSESNITNTQRPISSTSNTTPSPLADTTNFTQSHRNSNEFMQKLRVSSDQRGKLRKRRISTGVDSKFDSKTTAVEKNDHLINDKLSQPRSLQSEARISQNLHSPGLPRPPANTGKKIEAGPSKEPSVVSSGPSYFRQRSSAEYVPTTPSALSLHGGLGASVRSPGSNRTVGQQIAKMFVICCQCKHWHDMTAQAYAKLAFPSGIPSTTDLTPLTPTEAPASPSRQFSGSPLGSPNSSRTNLGVKEGKAPVKPIRPGAARSDSLHHSTICCWCYHQMAKSCCAGWTTIVTMRERHH
ncbi:hypothetical protein PRK78_005374 [Emydomyces testavorans]|uniref:Uncharacterized protein n=1 Tax=Emydomyces testavorans TaxID=2070801 RepID=A0AAF0IJZ5_9EURO|nr:hypothetical protein PRK78_005374 [Emydomyces testavorans]